MSEEAPESFAIPIEWHVPDGLVSRYATNMVVQHFENEFRVYFFEIRPPIVLGSPEETKTKLEQLGSVRAECVASIIVAPDRMQEFIRVLQENLVKSQAMKKE